VDRGRAAALPASASSVKKGATEERVRKIGLEVLLDSDRLPNEAADRMRALVNEANFFGLPPEQRVPGADGDRLCYQITVITPRRRHTVRVRGAADPPGLEKLAAWLREAADWARDVPS
jgi:hypothetical protein